MRVQRPNIWQLIELLKSRNFITPSKDLKQGVQFGPLGALMRQHIKKQWWDTMVQRQDNVFPVEHSQFPSAYEQEARNNSRSQLRTRLQSEYSSTLKLTNGQLPFSIASIGACENCSRNQNNTERDFFFGAPAMTEMLLQNYTPPGSGPSRVFDYWLQLRLSWWKRFSRNPANFQVVSSPAVSSNDNEALTEESPSSSQTELFITYEFPWGREQVEQVSNLGDGLLRSQSDKSSATGKKDPLAHCIQCSTHLEKAMAVFLIDSFHERLPVTASKTQTKSPQNNQVLKLHCGVAPYQVAVVRIPAPASDPYSLEISHVAKKLTKDLQDAGLVVFNAAHHGGSLVAHFRRNDQLGIPYTVVLNAETLNSGVITIRNRDTEIKEAVHLTHTVRNLQKYLAADLE